MGRGGGSDGSTQCIDADHRLLARRLAPGDVVGEVGDLVLEPALLDGLDGAAHRVDLAEDARRPRPRCGSSAPRRSRSRRADRPRCVTRVSSAMICCVRSAIFIASSVGIANASSMPLVCSDWAPPSTADSAWKRGAHDVVDAAAAWSASPPRSGSGSAGASTRASCAPKRSFMILRVDAPHRAELGDLLEEVGLGDEEEGQPRRELVDRHPGPRHLLDVGDRVRHREGDLLQRRRARLARCDSRRC